MIGPPLWWGYPGWGWAEGPLQAGLFLGGIGGKLVLVQGRPDSEGSRVLEKGAKLPALISPPRGSLECNPEIPAFPGEEY